MPLVDCRRIITHISAESLVKSSEHCFSGCWDTVMKRRFLSRFGVLLTNQTTTRFYRKKTPSHLCGLWSVTFSLPLNVGSVYFVRQIFAWISLNVCDGYIDHGFSSCVQCGGWLSPPSAECMKSVEHVRVDLCPQTCIGLWFMYLLRLISRAE